MFKSLTIISLFTSVALAQSSGTPAPSSTANPLIPSGISDACSNFLVALNKDADVAKCLASLNTATAAYGPGGNGTTSPSSANIGSTLGNLCSSTSDTCPESLTRGKLADFYSACSAELTSKSDANVLRTYDIFYTVTPLKTAICSKDDGGNYCVTQTKLPTSSSLNGAISSDGSSSQLTAAEIQKFLSETTSSLASRADSAALIPNVTTYQKTNLPFLFLLPSLPAADLCTPCTRNVLTSYINFESNVPYAPGLAKSVLLGPQSDLYTGVQNTCGKNFLSGAVQAAGGLSGGTLSSGAVQNVIAGSQNFITVGMGVLALAVSSVL